MAISVCNFSTNMQGLMLKALVEKGHGIFTPNEDLVFFGLRGLLRIPEFKKRFFLELTEYQKSNLKNSITYRAIVPNCDPDTTCTDTFFCSEPTPNAYQDVEATYSEVCAQGQWADVNDGIWATFCHPYYNAEDIVRFLQTGDFSRIPDSIAEHAVAIVAVFRKMAMDLDAGLINLVMSNWGSVFDPIAGTWSAPATPAIVTPVFDANGLPNLTNIINVVNIVNATKVSDNAIIVAHPMGNLATWMKANKVLSTNSLGVDVSLSDSDIFTRTGQGNLFGGNPVYLSQSFYNVAASYIADPELINYIFVIDPTFMSIFDLHNHVVDKNWYQQDGENMIQSSQRILPFNFDASTKYQVLYNQPSRVTGDCTAKYFKALYQAKYGFAMLPTEYRCGHEGNGIAAIKLGQCPPVTC